MHVNTRSLQFARKRHGLICIFVESFKSDFPRTRYYYLYRTITMLKRNSWDIDMKDTAMGGIIVLLLVKITNDRVSEEQ